MSNKYKKYTPIFEDLTEFNYLNEGSAKTSRKGGTWDRAGKEDKYYEEELGSHLKRDTRELRDREKFAPVTEYTLSDTAAKKGDFDESLVLTDNEINNVVPEDVDVNLIEAIEEKVMYDFLERRLPLLADPTTDKFLPTSLPKVAICTGEINIASDNNEYPIELVFEHDIHSVGNRFCFIVDRPTGTVITIKIVPGDWNTKQVADFINQDPSTSVDINQQIPALGVVFDKRRMVFAF